MKRFNLLATALLAFLKILFGMVVVAAAIIVAGVALLWNFPRSN